MTLDLQPRDAEIVVGLVARIGVDAREVVDIIKNELKEYDYAVHHIHVTDRLAALRVKDPLQESPLEARYSSYIKACNKVRSDTSNDVMARLAVVEITIKRGSTGRDAPIQSRNAYIIDQIKRPEESEFLRRVYGEHFVQISCHAGEAVRIDRLTRKISEDHPEDPKNSKWDIDARRLVHTDESQEEELSGQRVRQVFPLSDVVVDATARDTAERSLERFFRALFGDPSVTPTREEYGMQLANTAGQRSSDLSRQVGAAIVTPKMEVRALGCNEVPKSGGGSYWEGDAEDGRDFALGGDANEQRRQAVVLDLLLRLRDAGALDPKLSDPLALRSFAFERRDRLIADSQIMDSLEYGRSVHAEMNAITDAARTGQRIENCWLFSNTFPCHNCAKHIVSAGLAKVIYNHPYPKSYVKELFSDSIAVDPDNPVEGRVVFCQFIGIVGPMYARVFTKARWKQERGQARRFKKREASFIRRTPLPAYPATEAIILDDLNFMLKSKGYLRQNSK